MKTPEEILAEARAAAFAAAEAHDTKLGDEKARGFDCGFAWVVVKPARGPFITWCRKQKKACILHEIAAQYGDLRDYGGGGWQFWCTGFHETQSISTHRAAAEAFAYVLRTNNIPCEVGSRLD